MSAAIREVKAIAARIPESWRGSGYATFLAVVVLATCLLGTYAFWHRVHADANRALRASFEHRAMETIAHLEARLHGHEQFLRSAVGFVSGSGPLSREAFRDYLDSLFIRTNFPEVQVVGLAIAVDASWVDRYARQVRGRGFDEYRVSPEGRRSRYAPALYVERQGTESDLSAGHDLFSDPVRLEAMSRAFRQSSLAMSETIPIRRARAEAGTPGVALFLPFFDAVLADGAGTAPERVSGWVFSQVCMQEIMSSILVEDYSDAGVGIAVRLRQVGGTPGAGALYGAPALTPGAGSLPWKDLSITRRVSFGGQQWEAQVQANAGFEAGRQDRHPVMLMAAGVAISALLAALTWSLATGTVRARREAARMNAELVRSETELRALNDELGRRVAERTRSLESTTERLTLAVATANTGLWDWNLLTGEVHYSPEWAHQIGLDPREIGASLDAWESRLHPEDRERAIRTLREHLEHPEVPCEQELRLRHRDGTYRTILARSQAHADASGKPVRVVGSHLDITERKRTEDSLRTLARELREAARKLATVEEADRRAIAAELHDSIGSALTALGLNLAILRDRLPDQARPTLEPRLRDSLKLLESTVESVRDLMTQLRPPVLDDYGLATALRWHVDRLASQAGLNAVFRLSGPDARLPPDHEIALFRIVQEALANAMRHAEAGQVTVSMDISPDSVTILVEDDGVGFVVERAHAEVERPHWGLVTLRERAESMGGRCTVESAPGRGTRVVVEVPR